jgi:molybdopterin-binding protein
VNAVEQVDIIDGFHVTTTWTTEDETELKATINKKISNLIKADLQKGAPI